MTSQPPIQEREEEHCSSRDQPSAGHPTPKDAMLTLKLASDSGYRCTMKARVSAEQWGRIVAICEGAA